MPINNDDLKSRAEVIARLGRRSGLPKEQVLGSLLKSIPFQENISPGEITEIVEDAFYDPPQSYTGAILGLPPDEKK